MSEQRLPIFRLPVATLIWVVLAAVFTISQASTYAAKGKPEPLLEVFWWSGAEWLIYGALAPLVFRLARAVPLTKATWPRAIATLLIGWVVFHLVFQTGYRAIAIGIPGLSTDGWSEFGNFFLLALTKRAGTTLLVFSGIVGVAHLGELYRTVLERDRAAAKLEAALTRSRLEVLKGQLQPHFLFNTLNTVSALVHDDPEGAERVLSRLGDLLRMSLQGDGSGEVALSEELDFLERYVEIQQTRFADRLSVTIEVDGPIRRAVVPSLLLQPLVENAIRHGIEPRAAAGTVTVIARRDGDRLLITIDDDGVGMTENGTNGHGTGGHGVGLKNTRQRLAQLYGSEHQFTVGALPEGGTRVSIILPWRIADQAKNA